MISLHLRPLRRFCQIVISSCSLFAVSFSPAIPMPLPAMAKVEGWQQERYQKLLGKTVSTITKEGYCYSNPTSGLDTVCAPPSWSVIGINRARKLYFTFSDGAKMRKFSSALMLNTLLGDFDAATAKWELFEKIEYLGHPTEIWRAPRNPAMKAKATKNGFDGYEYWVAKDIPIPPGVAALNNKFFGSPLINYLGLKYSHVSPRRKDDLILHNQSQTG